MKTAIILLLIFFFSPVIAQSEQTGSGTFDNRDYWYKVFDDQRVLIRWEQFLPRDDLAVTLAMLHCIGQFYGRDKLLDLRPTLVKRPKGNLARFNGVDTYYYFLPIKQDTGEVHSFILWGEPK